MKFTFEESELINNLFENIQDIYSKELVIDKLKQIKTNTEEPELVEIVNTTIQKISILDEELLINIINDLPIDTYTTY